MKPLRAVLVTALLFLCATTLKASGPLGVYGVIEKVVFEPSEQAPERVQVWGAFAFADTGNASMATDAKKGYLYFTNPGNSATVRKEWMDLKAVAGTNQAVGFGSWVYIGKLESIQPDARRSNIYPRAGGNYSGLRILAATETPDSPAVYETNNGVVKLPATGNLATIVKTLQDALKK